MNPDTLVDAMTGGGVSGLVLIKDSLAVSANFVVQALLKRALHGLQHQVTLNAVLMSHVLSLSMHAMSTGSVLVCLCGRSSSWR